jgi:hypothetical protein
MDNLKGMIMKEHDEIAHWFPNENGLFRRPGKRTSLSFSAWPGDRRGDAR